MEGLCREDFSRVPLIRQLLLSPALESERPSDEGDDAGANAVTAIALHRHDCSSGVKFYGPRIRVGVESYDVIGYLRHAAFRRLADELTSPL